MSLRKGGTAHTKRWHPRPQTVVPAPPQPYLTIKNRRARVLRLARRSALSAATRTSCTCGWMVRPGALATAGASGTSKGRETRCPCAEHPPYRGGQGATARAWGCARERNAGDRRVLRVWIGLRGQLPALRRAPLRSRLRSDPRHQALATQEAAAAAAW